MYRIDLNSDLGESFGAYKLGMDSQIIPLVSSANVACGFHAGDSCVMAKTVQLCLDAGSAIGAHPGYPDLVGFGRRNMAVSPADCQAMVTYQLGALDAFCKAKGLRLQHVKPHGAMYNMAAKDPQLAKAICQAIRDFDEELILLALSGSEMITQAQEMGLRYAAEVFADRAYEEDGTLVSRTKPGAMIEDEELAVSRVITMIKEHKVTAVNGKEIAITPDSVCVHGDSEKALTFVQKLRDAFRANQIEVCPLADMAK